MVSECRSVREDIPLASQQGGRAMDATTLRHLIIPLATASLLMFVLHWTLAWDGAFLSLGSNLITILISILYVDAVLRRANAAKQAPADHRIRRRLQVLVNAGISSCRGAFGYGPDVLSFDPSKIMDPDDVHKDLIRVAEHVIEPSASSRIRDMDRKSWRILSQNVSALSTQIDTTLAAYGARLEPNVIAALLDVQDRLHAILALYSTWPDVLGVPDKELPPKRDGTSSIPHKQALTELASNDIQKLSQALRELSVTAISPAVRLGVQ